MTLYRRLTGTGLTPGPVGYQHPVDHATAEDNACANRQGCLEAAACDGLSCDQRSEGDTEEERTVVPG